MLVSVGLIDEAGYAVSFTSGTCIICDVACKIVSHFPKREGLYKVDTHHIASMAASVPDTSLGMANAHCHLGHVSPDAIQQLCRDGLITGLALCQGTNITTCDSCTHAKMTCKPVPKERNGKHVDSPGGEIHTDIWGLSPVKSLGGKSYYSSFTDDKTHFMWIYLLALKSDALGAYLSFEAWMRTQHGVWIK